VEKELTGRKMESWEIIYFKLYKTQISVIEQAIEDRSFDTGNGQVPKLLSGDDLCGLPGRSEPRKTGPQRAPAVHVTLLQIPAWRAKQAFLHAVTEKTS
jgi:hypothetical protein